MLTDRVALVTGASRGLGESIAIGLGAAGARVALVARNVADLERAAAQTHAAGSPEAVAFGCDVSDPDAVDALVERVGQRLGAPTILVNAAGVFGPLDPFAEADPRAWAQVIQINTIGSYLTCRAFLPGMLDAGWGRIVNVSSAAALSDPIALNGAYETSKIAVNHFTRYLAASVAGTGVTANLLHPGEVQTELWADVLRQIDALGPEGEPYRSWARWVEDTGGDPPEKAVALVLAIVAGEENGRFLWIEGGLQAPRPTWSDEPVATGPPPWRS